LSVAALVLRRGEGIWRNTMKHGLGAKALAQNPGHGLNSRRGSRNENSAKAEESEFETKSGVSRCQMPYAIKFFQL
jgi:hypothetical protein